jgi:hypothetical protein
MQFDTCQMLKGTILFSTVSVSFLSFQEIAVNCNENKSINQLQLMFLIALGIRAGTATCPSQFWFRQIVIVTPQIQYGNPEADLIVFGAIGIEQ